jgi:hypothetical protein
MHHGCIRWRQRRRGGSGRVVADIAKLSVGREEYYTRELATDHGLPALPALPGDAHLKAAVTATRRSVRPRSWRAYSPG